MFNNFKLFFSRIMFWLNADRIGPDIPLTHWQLHFKSKMRKLCQDKFLNFGQDSEFRPGAYAIVCSKISIGSRVVIRPGSMLFADAREYGAGITIEDDVMLGSAVHMYVSNHSFSDVSRPIIQQGSDASRPIVLREGCWVGAGAIILPGVTIGRNAVVGAGAVVTRDVPDFAVAVGAPAKVIKSKEYIHCTSP